MALQSSIQTIFGINLPSAYVKIESIQSTTEVATVIYHVYADEAARLNKSVPLLVDTVEIRLTDSIKDTLLTFLYDELKNVQKLKPAKDV